MNRSIKDLLLAKWIPTYKAQIGVLHNQLAAIRSALFVLRHIIQFPFDLFGEHDGPFWPLIRSSLEIHAIIGLWRILFDTSGSALTLRKLKNQVLNNAKNDYARDQLSAKLKEQDIAKRLRRIEKKLTDLRNNYFAHLDEKTVMGATPPVSAVTYSELDDLATTSHDLINAIAIDTQYMTTYLDYDPTVTRGGKRVQPDIELMFDDIVRRSATFRMPEEQPDLFKAFWEAWSQKEQEAFNSYRKKFGLPEVPKDY